MTSLVAQEMLSKNQRLAVPQILEDNNLIMVQAQGADPVQCLHDRPPTTTHINKTPTRSNNKIERQVGLVRVKLRIFSAMHE